MSSAIHKNRETLHLGFLMVSSLLEGWMPTQREYNVLKLSRVGDEYDLLLMMVSAVPALSEQISIFLEYEIPCSLFRSNE